ncbi:MAG: 7-cyano-7-deazaguanine synthase [Desulfosporosinus sp. BRH_c37]|nr:MAG: 7-cyano-7-deazaguanine synthase [Desulfosporosinus sp. BRH_c37]
MNQSALVVFSGGQDSTTCLFWAMKNFARVEAITFNYNQRHKAEIDCAIKIAQEFDVPHSVIDMSLLNQLAPNALTRHDLEIKASGSGELPTTFVDGRNLLFLSFAAVVAKQKGIHHIVTGVCETDFSGYPDCRDIFIKSLNVTLDLAMDYTFILDTPLMWIDKAETWELAEQLGRLEYVQHNTLTCYNGIIGVGCGNCPACKLRSAGLKKYLEKKEAVQ